MEQVIPDVFFRSSRPGYPSRSVTADIVQAWVNQAKQCKIRTILCLLDGGHLPYYDTVPGGLLSFYMKEQFNVVHRPVMDHMVPAVPMAELQLAFSDFLFAPKPLLVHCSAGEGRTGAVVNYLQHQGAHAFETTVRTLMERHCVGRPKEHFLQVTDNAIRLYDLLQGVHKLPQRYRVVLWAASMLHDIGIDPKLNPTGFSHAWASADHILENKVSCGLASSEEIATVASLHRQEGNGAEPPLGLVHGSVRALWPNGHIPPELGKLSAILRVADGLDYCWGTPVGGMRLEGRVLQINVLGENGSTGFARAMTKSELMKATLDVGLESGPPQGEAIRTVVATPRGRRAIIFDLLGTLVDYDPPNQAIPGMVALINQLRANHDEIAICTSCGESQARAIVSAAGFPADLPVFHGQNRGDLIAGALRHFRSPNQAWYFDDNPKGIVAASHLRGPALSGRIYGFVGSGQHHAALKEQCQQLGFGVVETTDQIQRIVGANL